MKSKKGISLIVLVITIIIVIIIASAVIISITNNNPVSTANQATFKNNVAEYKSELSLWLLNKYANTNGTFNSADLNADKDTGSYNNLTIGQIIQSMKTEDLGKFKIQNGVLVYSGLDETEKGWAQSLGMDTVGVAVPLAVASPMALGSSVIGTVVLSSEVNIAQSKYTVTDTSVPLYTVDASVWNTVDAKTFDSNEQNISFSGLSDGQYYVQMLLTKNNGTKEIASSDPVTVNGLIDVGYIQSEGTNAPVLKTGMVAKKWNSTAGTWDTVENPVLDTSWYNYTNKEWANAQTADGSMWVWIPRYEYKIPVENYHTSNQGTIDIKFLQGTNNAATEGYIVHPAFKFGTTELTGIWVAKFEASGSTSNINILPGVRAMNSQTVGGIYTACRNMETNSKYGLGVDGAKIDFHLIKNVEWGAVAYLSQSIYGKNSEIWKNPNSSCYTGHAGATASPASTASTYPYTNLTYGVQASTTGNVHGVYDMVGGIYEYVAAFMINGYSANGTTLASAPSQYKDSYTLAANYSTGKPQNYELTSTRKGDAIYETSTSGADIYSTWYNGYSSMLYSDYAFLIRGDGYNGDHPSIFSFQSFSGASGSNYGFRPTLLVNANL